MHHICKKNYNLIIKNFVPMCLRGQIAVLYRLRVIRVKLCRIIIHHKLQCCIVYA